MAYEGENLYQCRRLSYPWHLTHIVIVSGAKWNPCGHAILNAGGKGGHYFHIAGDGYDRPYYMHENGYARYLAENKKKELRRQFVYLEKPLEAQHKLDQLTSKKWLWGGFPNNCASFVEKILKAGGSSVGVYSNCPTLESWK